MSSSGFPQKTKPLIGGPASRSANQRPGFLAGKQLEFIPWLQFRKKTAFRYFSRVVKTQILGTKPQKQVKRKEDEKKSNLNLVCIGNISYRDQIDNIWVHDLFHLKFPPYFTRFLCRYLHLVSIMYMTKNFV